MAIPLLSSKKTTKDSIIDIISEEPGITIRKIENRIKKGGISVTYQAVRKAIIQLLRDSVLIKKRKNYLLNEKWIKSLSDFCEMLKAKSRYNLPCRILNSKKDYCILNFKRLIDRRDYLERFEREIIPKLKDKRVFILMPHGYYTALNQPRIKERINFFKNYGISLYRVYKGNTFLDKLSASVYRQCGAKVKLGVKYNDESWFMIYDDYIFQTIPSKRIKEMERKFFSSTKKFDDSYFKFMEEFYYKKCEIKVIIQKNHDLANRLKEQILKYF